MDERHHGKPQLDALLTAIDKESNAVRIIPRSHDGQLDWTRVFDGCHVMQVAIRGKKNERGEFRGGCAGNIDPSFGKHPSKILLLWRNMIAHCEPKPGSGISRIAQIDDVFKAAFPHLLLVVYYFCLEKSAVVIERSHSGELSFSLACKSSVPRKSSVSRNIYLPTSAPAAEVDAALKLVPLLVEELEGLFSGAPVVDQALLLELLRVFYELPALALEVQV
jgi:hypothetical protein